ncbi:hypothetical protein YTPLAS18_31770 [Nitrospira sp.]|nr:hypothetical protein YTPLAS18_31770 [Nitrospira sp.]
MQALLLFLTGMLINGCDLFYPPLGKPIGYSRDENGRPCVTYETKSGGYETVYDYQGLPLPPKPNATPGKPLGDLVR